MARGKQTCRILKEIRRQIAEANDIELITSECTFRGDCLGTCPKCEAEVRYLEQQLRARSLAGKAVAVAGISAAALTMLVPSGAAARQHNVSQQPEGTQEQTTMFRWPMPPPADTLMISGRVLEEDTLPDGTVTREPSIGAAIINYNSREYTCADTTGYFSIRASEGDSLTISMVGMNCKSLTATRNMCDTTVILTPAPLVEKDWGILGALSPRISDLTSVLILRIIDEDGNTIDPEILDVKRIWVDEYGYENLDDVSLFWDNYEQKHFVGWNEDNGLKDEDGIPLKEATLRIEAEGYDDPVIIKVKAPKCKTKKTVKFKRKKD